MFEIIIPTAAIILMIALTIFLLRRANAKKSKWGINFKATSTKPQLICPNCNSVFQKVRKPANIRQALWGGFTCKTCDKEYDKWLREITN